MFYGNRNGQNALFMEIDWGKFVVLWSYINGLLDAIINFCQKHMFLAARMDEVERVETLTVPFKVGHKIVTLVIRFKNSITPHRTGDEPVNDVLKDILDFIKSNPGIKKPAIIAHIGKSKATLTRYLKQLVEQDLIEYKGSDKTGGYYPKE